MTVHRFPTSLPSNEQVARAKDHVAPLAMQASHELLDGTSRIIAAQDASQLAEAISTMFLILEKYSRGFAALRDQTLLWWTSPRAE